MTEVWLPTKKTATLLNVDIRTIRRHCSNGLYKTRRVPGCPGTDGYEVALSSLPVEAQVRYRKDVEKAEVEKKLHELPERPRAEALKRYEILQMWEEYAADRKLGTSKVVEEFIEEVMEGTTTRATLYNWKKLYSKGGAAALAPKWKNVRVAFSERTFSADAKKVSLDLYEHINQPSKQHCYNLVLKEAARQGWNVPSYSQFKRFLDTVPKPIEWSLRHGKKAADDRALPFIERSNSNLKPLEIISGDHHQMDVAVKMPDGRTIFPWLTAWMDVRTWKIVGWALVEMPSSDSINIALRQVIMDYGIPGAVQIDNGKDYIAKRFIGPRKRAELEQLGKINSNINFGLYHDLGIEVRRAIVRNAKTKPIEKFFDLLESGFGKFCRGYRSNNVKTRSETLNAEIKKGEINTFDNMKKLLYDYIEISYASHHKHRGKGMENRTPNEVFYSFNPIKLTVSEAELALLCSPYPTARTVKQNGVYLPELKTWYWVGDQFQLHYLEKKVSVRYVEDEPWEIYVFDEKGKFLGIGEEKENGDWKSMNPEQYKALRRYYKTVKEAGKHWVDENIGARMTGAEREALLLKGMFFSVSKRLKACYGRLVAVF